MYRHSWCSMSIAEVTKALWQSGLELPVVEVVPGEELVTSGGAPLAVVETVWPMAVE